MDEFLNNDNIRDFTEWLAFSAEREAFYKANRVKGFMIKQDMGAALLLNFMTCEKEEFISYKMDVLRNEPLDMHRNKLFRTFIFVEDFADRSEASFADFLEDELQKNIHARLFTEFILYNFNTGTYRRIGGGKIQDRELRKLLDSAGEAARMTPEQRRQYSAARQANYRSMAYEMRPVKRRKGLLNPLVILLVINICIYLFDVLFEAGHNYKILEYYGIQHNALVLEGEWWRIITSIFLHDDMSHLLGNMLMLLYLSRVLTRYYTSLQYFLIYMASGIAGSIFTLIFMEPNVLSLGASGAIMGLGGVLVYRMFFGSYSKAFRRAGNYFILTFMVAYNLIYGLFVENINNYAHFSGFAVGFLLAMLLGRLQRKKNIEKQTA